VELNQSSSERSHFSVYEFKKNHLFVSQSLIGKMFSGKEKSISENKFIIYIRCFFKFLSLLCFTPRDYNYAISNSSN